MSLEETYWSLFVLTNKKITDHHHNSMKILTISGSAGQASSNIKLLEACPILFPEHSFTRYSKLHELPLFHVDLQNTTPPIVADWKAALASSDAVIISTPVYLFNIPALLKNALEWVTVSGELLDKKVLAITFTPHPPRGEKAMQSLLWSLQGLKANVVVQLPLYQNELLFDENNELVDNEGVEMLREAVRLLD